jgi:ionotropic kainate glutamate receptor 2
MNILIIFVAIGLQIQHGNSLPDIIRIGGLFHPGDSNQEIAFRYAVEKINADRTILPRSKLSAQIERILPQDSFHASKRVCHLLKTGVAAIFGPQSSHTASHVQSICDTMEIPHLETRWDYRLRRESCLVNLYPHPSTLSKAYVDLVRAWGWRQFTIIYETNEGLVRLQELLKAHGPSEYPITVRQLSDNGDYRPLLKQIKNSAEAHIVLDCSTEKIYDVLKQAQQIGMMSDYHSYLITSLDLHTVDLDEFKYGGTNITAFRLVDPNNPDVQQTVQNWTFGEAKLGKKVEFGISENTSVIKAETALMYDAVHLFAKALHDLDTSQQIDIHPLNCDTQDTWPHGYSLINYMKIVEMRGLTDVIKFDHQGFRTDFILDIIELSPNGLRKAGTWNSTQGINFTRTFGDQQKEIVEILQNKTLVVTTILSNPYCMRKEAAEKLSGNAQFEGYAIDLIAEISKVLGFNYTIRLAPDGRYGSYDKETGEWDGMIKELLEQRADLAVADLTITYDREQVVDFTMPFMNLGISVLYRKPVKQPPNLFSFLSPLSLDVWIYMATAYLGVSVLLFILARFSPVEWENPHPCKRDESTVLENQFTLLNSLWFTIGSLMQQGSDIAPKAVSTRMVAGIWWFFTLIMISSYTANLAAFLTVERMDSPIESAEDLAKQTKIKYGALKGGSTASFFRDSNFSTYQRMWSFMESQRPSVFTASNSEGVERVVKGKGSYAFLMESTSIEYVIERNCGLTQIGGLLDSKGYGIALPPNSPFRTAISGAVLKLQEEGKLHILKTRWWKEKRGGGSCRDDASKSSSAANELGLANVGGVFVVLMGGMGIACVIAVCEFVWKSRKVAIEEKVNHLLPRI